MVGENDGVWVAVETDETDFLPDTRTQVILSIALAAPIRVFIPAFRISDRYQVTSGFFVRVPAKTYQPPAFSNGASPNIRASRAGLYRFHRSSLR